MKKNAKEKGITLVALVVTIIVLLILAGVSISLVLGNNGVITKASTAVTENRKATAQEDIAMAWASCETDYLNEWTKNTSLVKSEYLSPDAITNKFNNQYLIGGQASNISREEDGSIIGTYTSDDNNTNVDFIIESNGVVTITGEAVKIVTYGSIEEAKGKEAVTKNVTIKEENKEVTIPAGYRVTDDSGNTIDEGIVIADSHGNEWVWVPVPNPSDLYETAASDAKLSDGTTPYTKYSKTMTIGSNGNTKTITRTTPGDSSGFREPDILAECLVSEEGENVYYDNDENAQTAGYASRKDMAEKMVQEYDEMIASIEQYKGFYVGRYEINGTTTNPTVQKDQNVITNTNWYNLVNVCKNGNLHEGSTTSGMIWGCQWDAMCDWIANYGDRKNIIDSKDWGNYDNSTGPAANDCGSKQTSGKNEAWKANNIYDVAGNFYEWTMESGLAQYNRSYRSGFYGNYGAQWPAYYRFRNNPIFSTMSNCRRISSHFNNKVTLFPGVMEQDKLI